ncbi:hypothetical protein F8S13_24545 [Chloroflexia bacterium SDU3-3]|nr:hypothetical protein F8S13_24545 [Chloroflexia bacterium SDU3-3]
MSYQSAGRFGRIPPDTVSLLQRSALMVQEKVLPALPRSASEQVRAYVTETVLEFVLRDWRENENTEGLLFQDIEDIKSFVALAASLAGSDLNISGLPIFQATLRALLEDWLANWNSPGDPGPPGPID